MASKKKTKDEDVRKCVTRNCKEVPYATRAKYCEKHAAERRAESLKAGSLAFRERKAAGTEPAKRLLYKGELTKDALANPKKYLGQAKKLEAAGNQSYLATLNVVIERQSQEKAAAKLEKSKTKKEAK